MGNALPRAGSCTRQGLIHNMESIVIAYEEVKGRIASAAAAAGRDPSDIELVAVSKTWPPETVSELVAAGHELFGENKVQELIAKVPALPGALRWHFIGHLQRNKVRKVLPLVEAIHSVDSVELGRRIDSISSELGLFPRIYLQVNTAAEASKSGFSPERLTEDIESLLELDRVEIVGLMSIPPQREDDEQRRRDFRQLRELRDRLQDQTGIPFPGLSMGMSNDFELAVAEGATIVRVGSSIFGRRKVPMT